MLCLANARPELIIQNLPIIFNSIIQLLVQPPTISGHILNVGNNAFEALCLVLNRLSVNI